MLPPQSPASSTSAPSAVLHSDRSRVSSATSSDAPSRPASAAATSACRASVGCLLPVCSRMWPTAGRVSDTCATPPSPRHLCAWTSSWACIVAFDRVVDSAAIVRAVRAEWWLQDADQGATYCWSVSYVRAACRTKGLGECIQNHRKDTHLRGADKTVQAPMQQQLLGLCADICRHQSRDSVPDLKEGRITCTTKA